MKSIDDAKRVGVLIVMLALQCSILALSGNAQQYKTTNGRVIVNTKVLTMVVPTNLPPGDYFVMVRQEPNANSRIITKIYDIEGEGSAVLLAEPTGRWVRVGKYKDMGFSNSYYLKYHKWYTGKGKYQLIADGLVPVYQESEADPEEYDIYSNPFCYLRKGTIIADEFYETAHEYRLRLFNHNDLIVRKANVRKVLK